MTTVLLAIYSHPELYPPTLYAVQRLAGFVDRLTLLHRPHLSPSWPYPANVRLRASGRAMSVREQMNAPALRRHGYFAEFVGGLTTLLRSERPNLVVLHDPIALLAFSIARLLTRYEGKVWYHNHDVLEGAALKPLSLGWLAARAEKQMFPHLDLFSLPAEERRKYFPMNALRGEYAFVPNFPSRWLYGAAQRSPRDDSSLRLIYQGSVCRGHGIEELIEMMPFEVRGRRVHLILKGWFEESFRRELDEQIERRGVAQHVEMLGFSPPHLLPEVTASCHVGIAIYTRSDVMNTTLGTAGNKIYEYAAVGLPVIYHDSAHFRQHLSAYPWAVPTTLDAGTMCRSLEHVVDRYDDLSRLARADFESSLSHELRFDEALARLGLSLETTRPETP